MDVERLIKLGEKLELKGEPLRQWVATQIKEEEARKEKEIERAREEDERREKERERAREDEERKEKERERAREEEERKEKDRERAREDEERKEREKERLREEDAINKARAQRQEALLEKELELIRLKSELQASSADESMNSGGRLSNRAHPAKSPRLPCFDENKDQMDSYLLRFERYASINEWEREDWATYLSSLLKGKSLDVYTRLSDEEAVNYDIVKSALLKRYNLTDDGFNEKFRKSKPETGERFDQFATRIKGYLEKWIELAGKNKESAEEILDMILKEQLMNVCSRDLVMFMKERKPKTVEEVIDLGEKYVEAHGVTGAFVKNSFYQEKGKETHSHAPTNKETISNRPPNAIVCHNCRRPGHLARDCRTRKQAAAVGPVLQCQYCHRRGHQERECWEKRRRDATDVKPTTSPQVSAMATDTALQRCTAHNKVELKCGCEMPMLSAACLVHDPSTPEMPVATGLLDGKKVKVLRDSGSSGVIIRKGLVSKKDDEWKRKVMVYLANGTSVAAPRREAYLECPYFTGKLSAIEMETPLYDVILGNIEGAKCPGTPIKTENGGELDIVEVESEELSAAYARAQQERKVKDLRTAPWVKQKQVSDETLEAAKESTERGDAKKTYHTNLKKYFERAPTEERAVGVLECAVAAVIDDEDGAVDVKTIPRMELPALKQTESKEDNNVHEALDIHKESQLHQILHSYEDILRDVPSRTDKYTYDIKLTSDPPIRKKPDMVHGRKGYWFRGRFNARA